MAAFVRIDIWRSNLVCECVRKKSSLAFASARSCPTLIRRMRLGSLPHSKINQLEGLAVAIPWGFESPLPHSLRSPCICARASERKHLHAKDPP